MIKSNIKKNEIAKACITLFLGIIIGVVSALSFNNQDIHSKKAKQFNGKVKYFFSKNKVTKNLSEKESNILRLFRYEYQKSVIKTLKSDEIEKVKEVKNEVLSTIKNNRAFLNYENLTDETQQVMKKVKKIRSKIYKKLPQEDLKILKGAIKKMNVNEIVELFDGIK